MSELQKNELEVLEAALECYLTALYCPPMQYGEEINAKRKTAEYLLEQIRSI